MASYYVPGQDEGDERRWEVETIGEGRYKVTWPDGRTAEVDAYEPGPDRMHVVVDGHARDLVVRQVDSSEWVVDVAAERHGFEVLNDRARRMRAAGVGGSRAGGPELTSPMAGKVIAINVAPGDAVEQGQPILIVEAMKMENELKAHISGVIESVKVEPGVNVEIGDVLVVIDAGE